MSSTGFTLKQFGSEKTVKVKGVTFVEEVLKDNPVMFERMQRHSLSQSATVMIEDGPPFFGTEPTMPRIVSLGEVVPTIRYKPGWSFHYDGMSLMVYCASLNSCDMKTALTTNHRIPTPVALFHNRHAAEDWVMAKIIEVETHEAMEFFRTSEGRPFFPHEAGGGPVDYNNPFYAVTRRSTPAKLLIDDAVPVFMRGATS